MTVTEIIGNKYKKWLKPGTRVLLDCATGSGKTDFALNIMSQYAIMQQKSVCYLCNRTKLKEQILEHIKEKEIKIDVITYQSFINLIIENKQKNYDLYICDECHYFLSDALFNEFTDVMFEYLLNTESSQIYMSATAYHIKELIQPTEIIQIKSDYSYIDKCIFYNNSKEKYNIIDHLLNTKEQILVFCNSKTEVDRMYQRYYTVGKNRIQCIISNANRYTWEQNHTQIAELVPSLEDGFTFTSQILVATKVIDNGINIIDSNVKHIFCEIFDIESALQCIGRKRNNHSPVNIYIKDWKPNEVQKMYERMESQYDYFKLFVEDREEWKKLYRRSRRLAKGIIINDDDQIDYNHLMYQQLKIQEYEMESIINHDHSYKEIILNNLNNLKCIPKYITEINKELLSDFIQKHLSKELTEEDMNFIKNITQCKSIKDINYYLMNTYGKYKITKIGNFRKFFTIFY